MPKFSERYGYTPIERAFQRERMDETLRIGLWNVLSLSMWGHWELPINSYSLESGRINAIAERAWLYYFKRDLDRLPEFRYSLGDTAYSIFKDHFFKGEWFEAYNFLEFLLQDRDTFLDEEVVEWLNEVLETENAAYRVISNEIVEITDTNEIKAIEEALDHPDAPIREHIKSALTMLSDRETRDYRNSIKESISAVEAACRIVSGSSKATLGDALSRIPDLHPALKRSFKALYGYTNEAPGIRHSLLDESNLTYADAKFMLASCSAFVSYLRSNETNKIA